MLFRYARYVIALSLVWSCAGCDTVSDVAPSNVMVIQVTGEEFNWHFRYPGQDGVLGTDDDDFSVQDMYLPENTEIVLQLASNDYLYSFALPELELREIAVPGLSFELKFRTKGEQTLQLLGDQLCGFSHETLIGNVYVGAQLMT